jgi:hypothetical protein
VEHEHESVKDILGLEVTRTVWNDKFSDSSKTPNVKKTVHNTVQIIVILTTVIFGSFMHLAAKCLLTKDKEIDTDEAKKRRSSVLSEPINITDALKLETL